MAACGGADQRGRDDNKIVVLGGCGHIGLPLCVRLALAGWAVVALDVAERAVATVNAGVMPFKELHGEELLARALATGRFHATTDASCCSRAKTVIFTNGMDLDEHGNPKLDELLAVFDKVLGETPEDTLYIFRSTLYPGTMSLLSEHLTAARQTSSSSSSASDVKVTGRLAYCPERTAERFALEEIVRLPQV